MLGVLKAFRASGAALMLEGKWLRTAAAWSPDSLSTFAQRACRR